LKKKADKNFSLEKTFLEKCKAHLHAEKPLRELPLTAEEKKPIGGFLFLSQRPMLFVLNLGDEEASQLESAVERHKLGALQGRRNTAVVAVCGRLEAELAEMDDKEAAELLASYGLKEPGLNRLIRATYDLMGLTSFFTAGEPEVRAWTIHKGTHAVKAAGAIHSDIEKGFIRAEVVRCDDLLAAGSLGAARERPRSASKARTTSSKKATSSYSATPANVPSPTAELSFRAKRGIYFSFCSGAAPFGFKGAVLSSLMCVLVAPRKTHNRSPKTAYNSSTPAT